LAVKVKKGETLSDEKKMLLLQNRPEKLDQIRAGKGKKETMSPVGHETGKGPSPLISQLGRGGVRPAAICQRRGKRKFESLLMPRTGGERDPGRLYSTDSRGKKKENKQKVPLLLISENKGRKGGAETFRGV